MAEIPEITDPSNHLEVAETFATILNENMAEQFKAAKEAGYDTSDLQDSGLLAQVAQVNYLAVLARKAQG